jgi:hypothetical protein
MNEQTGAVSGYGLVACFKRANDGSLTVRTHRSEGWHGWQSLHRRVSSGITIVKSEGHITVFARGEDEALHAITWDGARWGGWYPLGGKSKISSAPSVVKEGQYITVFARGEDEALHAITWDGTRWGGWYPLGGKSKISSAPSVVKDGQYITVFARGEDEALHAITWDGTRWGGWYSLEIDIVTPNEVSYPISNPGMGWMLEEMLNQPSEEACRGTNEYPPIDPFPRIGIVEVIGTWSEIEQVKGKYDWSRVDEVIDYWTTYHAKRISLRICTESGGCYVPDCVTNYAGYQGIPQWLKATLEHSGSHVQTRQDGNGSFEFPDYTNRTYQKHLRRFLAALARKYGDHPAVELVNLRGYGEWGEWHSGHDFSTMAERVQTLRWIIDTWIDAWKSSEKLLAISASYEFRQESELRPSEASIHYIEMQQSYTAFEHVSAFDYALGKERLTFRRDGFDGSGDIVKSSYDGRLLKRAFLARPLPLIAEFFGPYQLFPGRKADAAYEEAINHHVNYIMVMGWACSGAYFDAEVFYRERQDLIEKGLMADGMGYRLVITEIHHTNVIRVSGDNFDLITKWKNLSVGRCYLKCYLQISLINGSEQVVWEHIDKDINLTNLLRGQSYTHLSHSIIPGGLVDAGTLRLRLALVQTNTGRPLELAMEGADLERRYDAGSVAAF